MGIFKKKPLKGQWRGLIFMVFILGLATYYILFFTPKNSLELYQALSFAKDFEEAQEVMLEGYEGYFKEEDFEFINRLDTSADRIKQFTLFEYDEKIYLIMTTPGTERLKVLSVEELPEDIREYYLKLTP